MADSITHKADITTASSASENDTNIAGDSNVVVVNKGDGNWTHIGHDNRNNQGVIIIGGSAVFTDPRASIEILNELPRAPAYYDSSLRKQARQCMEETRIAVLNTIFEWADSDNPPIFWLHGPAGTGKSTIAHTVAEECRRRGILGASFFFAHASAECGDANLFFSTIAYQLSKFDPDLRQHIIDGVRAHSSPQDASIPTQFEEFVLIPLYKLSNGPARGPIIVVVDAFDECSDARKASQILRLLLTKIPNLPLRLKFLITSRPEPEIRSILYPDIDGISRSFDLLRDIDAFSMDEDIKRFLRFQLGRIGKEYYLPSWPREMDVGTLARQAGGVFIFAHTGIEFIKDKDVSDPESQLATLINIGTNSTPALNLNALYSRILRKAMSETATATLQGRVVAVIHVIVGVRAPLTLGAIERLLGFDRGAVRTALNRLRSIFIVPDNDEDAVQVIHPSFAQYVTDKESCTEKTFFVGRPQLHSHLAKLCLKQMKTHLKQNICNFKDFATMEAPIKDGISSDVNPQLLSEELRYSCQNFAAHVHSGDWHDGELGEMVAEWAYHCLLYWLEVLALIGSFRDALPSLRLLCEIASASPVESPIIDNSYSSAQPQTLKAVAAAIAAPRQLRLPSLRQLTDFYETQTSKAAESKSGKSILQFLPKQLVTRIVTPKHGGPQMTESPQLLADAIRMVSESYDDIKRFPHQIYTSCLAFCPLDSTLFKKYSRLSAVRVLRGERKKWRPLLHSFKDPDGFIVHLIFSPDGTTLASRSSVGKILLWNLGNSESRLLARHPLHRYATFTFSPDGKYIAVGGNVYRAATGEEVLTDGVCSAFSPDGLYITLGYANGTIRLHGMHGQKLSLLGEISGHEGMVTTLAFSSDNKFLTSASSDNTIRVWNSSSREMIKQIPNCEPSGSLAFSRNGRYIAARYEHHEQCKELGPSLWIADTQTGKENSVRLFNEHQPRESTTIFSPNGTFIASSMGNALYIASWVAATQVPDTLLGREFGNAITSISFTPDEQSLLLGNEQGLIRSWRIPKDGGAATTFDFEYKAHFGPVQKITFSPDGKYFASASIDGSICVWDFTSIDLHEPSLVDTSVKQTAVFAPDGRNVAVGFGNGISKIDATTGYSIFSRQFTPNQGNHRLIFSADGKYLAGNSIQELLFWETGSTSRNWRRSIVGHTFSPDATHYAVLFSAGQLWVHDLRNGESRKVVQTNRTVRFERLIFSHDSRHLVSYFGDICVFDVDKGVQTDLNLPVRSYVFHCAFSPCGRNIAIAHDNGLDVSEYLAEKANVKEVHRQNGYWSVEFSPDGKYILAAARGDSEGQLDLFHPDTLEILYTIKLWSGQHVDQAIREFKRTGRLLNHPLFQPSEYDDFPYLLDNDGWVISASSKRLCRLPVANRGEIYDVNGNRIVVLSPEGKVTLVQFGPNSIYITVLS